MDENRKYRGYIKYLIPLYIIYSFALYIFNVFYQNNIIPQAIIFNWKFYFLILFALCAINICINHSIDRFSFLFFVLISIFFITYSLEFIICGNVRLSFFQNLSFYLVPTLSGLIISKNIPSKVLLNTNLYLAIIVSLIAIYQLIFDNTLFNAYPKNAGMLDWEFWRMPSTIGSPMMLGMYLGLSVSAYLLLMKGTNVIFIVILIIGGLISGSKVFGAIFILSSFAFLKVILKPKYLIFLLIPIILGVIFIIPKLDNTLIDTFKRAFFLQDNLMYTESTNRMVIYDKAFADISENLLGNDISEYSMANRISDKNDDNHYAVESYQLTLLYDTGIIGSLVFNMMFLLFIIKNRGPHRLFSIIFYFATFPVHSLFFSYFYVFWALLFYDLRNTAVAPLPVQRYRYSVSDASRHLNISRINSKLCD